MTQDWEWNWQEVRRFGHIRSTKKLLDGVMITDNIIQKYRDEMWIGMVVKVPSRNEEAKGTVTAKVIEKFPYVVKTTKGVFRYVELYMIEHGMGEA